ncbi:ABC transporter permease [Tissierella sp. MSJ-40]|uniref:ABC transporter permease n=1 Tax=Tissierella simiarum TaxID=2841534 RepID=A0ABS6E2A0_9FIRM|nr:ABC transporter permease [Tissierella simiarum]MBU5436917.1 ABC transporter permease [Tissierella simiarum]
MDTTKQLKEEIKIKEKDFKFVQLDEKIYDEKFEGEAIGFFKDAMLRFKKNRAAIVSGWIIAFIVFMAIFGPMMNEYTYREQHLEWAFLPPRVPGLEKLGIFDGTKEIRVRKENIEEKYGDALIKVVEEYNVKHQGRDVAMAVIKVDAYKLNEAEDVYFWLGTDSIGRDQWTRLWRGSRVSLFIGVMAVIINMFIGVVYGSVSGYYGGWIDMVLQRITEVLGGIPSLVLIMLFIMYMGAGIIPFILAMVLTGWIGMSRMIRAQFYKYKGQEYVLASRTMGAKDRSLIFRHILPNAIGPIITQATLAVPGFIFTESMLSYLGLGLGAPEPSIGVLLAEGQKVLLNHPHLTLFPAMVISILMLAFNLFGNGLRDAFDPTLRGQE